MQQCTNMKKSRLPLKWITRRNYDLPSKICNGETIEHWLHALGTNYFDGKPRDSNVSSSLYDLISLISEMFHSCLFCSTKSPRCWEDLNGQYRAKVDTPSKLPRHWRHNWPRRRFLPLPICCFSCRSVEVFSLAMYLQTQVVSQRYWEWIETATATAMETATIWL